MLAQFQRRAGVSHTHQRSKVALSAKPQLRVPPRPSPQRLNAASTETTATSSSSYEVLKGELRNSGPTCSAQPRLHSAGTQSVRDMRTDPVLASWDYAGATVYKTGSGEPVQLTDLWTVSLTEQPVFSRVSTFRQCHTANARGQTLTQQLTA